MHVRLSQEVKKKSEDQKNQTEPLDLKCAILKRRRFPDDWKAEHVSHPCLSATPWWCHCDWSTCSGTYRLFSFFLFFSTPFVLSVLLISLVCSSLPACALVLFLFVCGTGKRLRGFLNKCWSEPFILSVHDINVEEIHVQYMLYVLWSASSF